MADSIAFSSDLYALLECPRDAGQAEIRRCYRRLAKKYHPDAGAAETDKSRFQQIAAAYGILSHPERKAAYDALLEMGVSRPEKYVDIAVNQPPPPPGSRYHKDPYFRRKWQGHATAPRPESAAAGEKSTSGLPAPGNYFFAVLLFLCAPIVIYKLIPVYEEILLSIFSQMPAEREEGFFVFSIIKLAFLAALSVLALGVPLRAAFFLAAAIKAHRRGHRRQ